MLSLGKESFRLILQEKIAIFDVADSDAPMANSSEILLGQFVPGHSWMHRADPRSKLFATLAVSTALLATASLTALVVLAVVLAVAARLSGLPRQLLARRLRPFLWLFVIIFLFQMVWNGAGGRALVRIDGVAITTSGLLHGTVYSVRLGLLIMAAVLLTMTTMPLDLMDGVGRLLRPLKRFRVPVDEWTLTMGLALRFIPTLLSEATRIKQAQLSRGGDFEGGVIKRLRAVVPMVLPLFVAAFRRADDLAMAMEARCYTFDRERSSYTELRLGRGDYLLIAASLLLVAASAVSKAKGWPV